MCPHARLLGVWRSVVVVYGDVLLAIGATLLLGLVVPGPNLAVIAANASVSRRAGYAAASGATLGALLIASIGVLGWTHLAAVGPGFGGLLQFAGGALLVGLGVRAVARAAVLYLEPKVRTAALAAPAAPFRTALLTCLANPVTLTVYAGVFATLLPPAAPLWLRCAVVALVGGLSFAWYAVIAATAGRLAGPKQSVLWHQVAGLALGAVLVVVGWRAILRTIS